MALEYNVANFNIISWQQTDYDRNVNPAPMRVKVPRMLPDGSIVYVYVVNMAQKKKEVDDFVANGKANFPFINILSADKTFQREINFPIWNPNAHTIEKELVKWDYNSVTKEMASKLHFLDGEGNPRCCGLLTDTTINFLKVNITPNPDKVGQYFSLSGFFGVYQNNRVWQGVSTALIGAVGCESGNTKISTSDSRGTIEFIANKVETSLSKIVYQVGWTHYDAFALYPNEATELYFALPMVVAGSAVELDAQKIITLENGV